MRRGITMLRWLVFLAVSVPIYNMFKRAQDNILDIASQDTRLSLCWQLQQLGNAIAQEPHEVIREATVTFDLPGVSQVEAHVTIEHDHFLVVWMGSMVIHLDHLAVQGGATTLTASNLQNLPSSFASGKILQSGHRLVGLQSWPRSERSHSKCSSRYSSHSSSRSYPTRSRSSRQARSQRSEASGAISEMYQLHEVRFTKSRL